MKIEMNNEILKYIEESFEETLQLIESLCGIPAPSWHEEKRAEFVKAWLEEQGAEGVYIDSALNVLYPVGCEGKSDIVLFLAHTDTVFPDTEPMPFSRDEKYLYSPGVGDDTTSLAVMLMIAKYIAKNKLKAPSGILFAANAGEEGLGNLKGIKQIMKDYDGRITEVYSFDAHYTNVYDRCVGSHRYEITFTTEGGHSYQSFGNRNAIAAMADFICRMYATKVPEIGDSRTTYNVGVVEGGTSVNTIAQSAKMLYEYRSDSAECIEIMQRQLEREIESLKAAGKAEICVRTVGIRPCADGVDERRVAAMRDKVVEISERHSGIPCTPRSASTDCNIPMSMGVPAVCVGLHLGYGSHTREEKVEISSISVGLKIAAELILGYFN